MQNLNKLKITFLRKPFAEHDETVLNKLVSEVGLEKDEISHWFKVMRKRMNIGKFLNNGDEDDDVIDDVSEEEKNSGKSPLDIPVLFVKIGQKEIGDETYNEEENTFVEDETLETSKISTNIDESVNEHEITEKMDLLEKDSEIIKKIKIEAIVPDPVVEGNDNVSNPKNIINVKKEPVDNLTTVEKAMKYDQMKAEMELLQKQMEEMKQKLFQTQPISQRPPPLNQGPVSSMTIKQEPRVPMDCNPDIPAPNINHTPRPVAPIQMQPWQYPNYQTMFYYQPQPQHQQFPYYPYQPQHSVMLPRMMQIQNFPVGQQQQQFRPQHNNINNFPVCPPSVKQEPIG